MRERRRATVSYWCWLFLLSRGDERISLVSPVIDGHHFTKDRSRNGNTYYKCTPLKNGCTEQITLNEYSLKILWGVFLPFWRPDQLSLETDLSYHPYWHGSWVHHELIKPFEGYPAATKPDPPTLLRVSATNFIPRKAALILQSSSDKVDYLSIYDGKLKEVVDDFEIIVEYLSAIGNAN